ncbi:MAG: hypothetical protein H0T83_07235 [Chthoniobacterales bacterium]|nr:hypothetical protein [Chthoniobacterales bacterium]
MAKKSIARTEQLSHATAKKCLAAPTTNAHERILEFTTQIGVLKALTPICIYCKRVRDDSNYWDQVAILPEAHRQQLQPRHLPHSAMISRSAA